MWRNGQFSFPYPQNVFFFSVMAFYQKKPAHRSCAMELRCPITLFRWPTHPLIWSKCQKLYSRGVTSKVYFSALAPRLCLPGTTAASNHTSLRCPQSGFTRITICSVSSRLQEMYLQKEPTLIRAPDHHQREQATARIAHKPLQRLVCTRSRHPNGQ